MKTLKLTTYPQLVCEGDRPKDRLRHEFAKGAERKQAEAKHLTDAELAAEYWSAAEEATSHHFRATDRANEAQRIEGKLYDFARAPHASESDYQ